MTAATILTKRFVLCPDCGKTEHAVEHLFADAPRSFGPWTCGECRARFQGEVHLDGTVTLEVVGRRGPPGLALLRLGELYLVYEERYGRVVEGWDYLYHSHQCTESLLRETMSVFTSEGRADPHGIARYVAGIEDTSEAREKLEKVDGIEALFDVFGTDGTPPWSEWHDDE